MSIYIGVPSTSGSTSLTLDLDALTSRVANMLRRNDAVIKTEIQQWLNFSQRELCHRVNFPELRAPVVEKTLTIDKWKYDISVDLAIADFDHVDGVYYEDITASPTWGKPLIPAPRQHYKELYEKLLHRTDPGDGDPRLHFLDGDSAGTYWILYPAPNKAAKCYFSYYKIPADMTLGVHEPSIKNRWRHYLAWLAFYWGKSVLDAEGSEGIIKAKHWEGKFERTIITVRGLVEKAENKRMSYLLPETGFESADKVHGR
jgi:hypothetical protein